jgi:hypothetical protein
MASTQVIQPDQPYTFADYFKLNYDTEDVLAYFGYDFQPQSLTLPRSQQPLDRLDSLKQRLEESLPYLSLTNEMARREFLVAPVLMELIHYTQVRIKVSYPLTISEQLRGELDYFLQLDSQLLVIEAKNADLQKGFTQLGVELIALAQSGLTDSPVLYGAVTVGNIWQFGALYRQEKRIVQDLNLFRVPADLDDLMAILVAIVKGEISRGEAFGQ